MRAIRPHARSFPAAPAVAAGGTVRFDRHDPGNPGWFFGRDARGVGGYFPAGWFEIDEARGSARASRDYDAAELAVGAGDPLDVLDEYGGWLLVASSGGRGWIPRECAGP